MSSGQRLAVVAAIATIVAALIAAAALIYQVSHDNQSSSAGATIDQPSHETGTGEPSSSTPQTVEQPSVVPVPPAPMLTNFVVGTAKLETGNSGKAAGPNQYQFVSGDDLPFYVGYTWSARYSDGTEDSSSDCALLVTVTGPDSYPAERYQDCSWDEVPFLGGNGGNDIKITRAGNYHVHVADQGGATGDVSFVVYPG